MSTEANMWALDRALTRSNPRALSDDERARGVARFMERVPRGDPHECWVWAGPRNSSGYGQFGSGGLAHRIMLEITLGRRLNADEHAMHSCDNRPCVNPRHLSAGTARENFSDMRRKGRARRGVPGGVSKLSAEQVREIRRARAAGATQQEMADLYGVTRPAISAIDRGRSFGYLERGEGEDRPTGRVRSRHGADLPWSKLSAEQVREIRRLHAEGVAGKEIAPRFGVTPAAISLILNGKSYRWVE